MLLGIAIFLAVVAIAALIFNPATGILVLLVFKAIIDTAWDEMLLPGLNLTRIVGAIIPMIMIMWMLRSSGSASFRFMPMKWLWLVYCVDIFLFSIFALFNSSIMDGIEIFLRHIHGFIGFYMFQAYFHEPEKMKRLFWALVLGGIFPISVGIYQSLTGVTWHTIGVGNLIRSIGLYHDVMTVRFHSLQPVLAALLLVSLFYKSLRAKMLAACYGGIGVFVALKGYTKAGSLAIVLWCLQWTVFQKKYLHLAGVIVIVAGLVALTGSPLLEQYTEQVFNKEIDTIAGELRVDETLEGRFVVWYALIDEWGKLNALQQLFGSGIKSTGAHNDYVQILFHGGLFGLLVYITLLLVIGFRIAANLWEKVEPLRLVALMVYTMWIIDTVGLVPSSYASFQWLVWGLVGLSFRVRENERREAKARRMSAASRKAVSPVSASGSREWA